MKVVGGNSSDREAVHSFLKWIPSTDYAGIRKIAIIGSPEDTEYFDDPSPQYVYDDLSQYLKGRDDGQAVNGVYYYDTKDIFLSKRGVQLDTVIHEIGHHLTVGDESLRIQTHELMRNVIRELDDAMGESIAVDFLVEMTGDSGLDWRSFGNEKEFLADAYKILQIGTTRQKQHLEGFWECIGGVPSLKELIDGSRYINMGGASWWSLVER